MGEGDEETQRQEEDHCKEEEGHFGTGECPWYTLLYSRIRIVSSWMWVGRHAIYSHVCMVYLELTCSTEATTLPTDIPQLRVVWLWLGLGMGGIGKKTAKSKLVGHIIVNLQQPEINTNKHNLTFVLCRDAQDIQNDNENVSDMFAMNDLDAMRIY